MTREECRVGQRVMYAFVSSMFGTVEHVDTSGAIVEWDNGVKAFMHFDNINPGLFSHAYTVGKPSVDLSRFPHICPRCGQPAYVGFLRVEHKDDIYNVGECP